MARKRKTEEPWSESELRALPTSRQEARALGSKYYFRNKPCKRGHIAPYFTSVSKCTMCAQIESLNAYRKNPQKALAYQRAMHTKHREKRLEGLKRYKFENPEVIKKHNAKRDKEQMALQSRLWRQANPEKYREGNKQNRLKFRAKRIAQTKLWRSKNTDHLQSYRRQYRAINKAAIKRYEQAMAHAFRKRLPKWGDVEKIKQVYARRDALNAKYGKNSYHVDHIVPRTGKLRGKQVVSGLHVHNNLRIIRASENLKKGATYDPWTGDSEA